MRKFFVIFSLIILSALIGFLYYSMLRNENLYEQVREDFSKKHPQYELIDLGIGEGDMVVSYVHIKYTKSESDKIHEEVWQYWDLGEEWMHRDEYLKINN